MVDVWHIVAFLSYSHCFPDRVEHALIKQHNMHELYLVEYSKHIESM